MFEYPLIRRGITCETEQNKNSSHIAEGLKSAEMDRSNPVRSHFFSVRLRCLSIEFSQKRYPLSPAMGVTDHTESEYVLFIHRTPTLQNSFGVICIHRLFFIFSAFVHKCT